MPNFLGDGGSEEPARLALAEWLREGDEKRKDLEDACGVDEGGFTVPSAARTRGEL